MKKNKITVCFMLIAVLIVGACSQSDSAKSTQQDTTSEASVDYPTQEIEWIIPFPPGGTTDTSARILAKEMSKHLPNEPEIVVVNKEGGNSTIGLTEVYNADPDGYTIGTTTAAPLLIEPLEGNTSYSYDDFQPVAQLIHLPQFFLVSADSPWTNFEEWLEYVKQNPGELKYALAGVGNPPHLATEM